MSIRTDGALVDIQMWYPEMQDATRNIFLGLTSYYVINMYPWKINMNIVKSNKHNNNLTAVIFE
jgi:hypothetical protein